MFQIDNDSLGYPFMFTSIQSTQSKEIMILFPSGKQSIQFIEDGSIYETRSTESCRISELGIYCVGAVGKEILYERYH